MTEGQLLFIERCWRLIRLKQLGGPEQVQESARKLIKESVQELSGDEIAQAMQDFPSTVAKLQRIDREVEAAHPWDPNAEPEDPEDE